VLLEELGGPPVDGKLGLELRDPTLGRGKLFPLRGTQPRRETAIDVVPMSPDIDDLLTDPEIPGDIATFRPAATSSTTRRRNSAE
jgi:hypothetical protein